MAQLRRKCMALTSPSSLFFVLVYTGNAPGQTKEIGYNILVIMNCFGQMTQFFLSEYISVEANLYVITVTLLLAVPLFTVADHHFGSGRSRRCCCKKPVAQDGNSCNAISNGSEENGMHTHHVCIHACIRACNVVCDIGRHLMLRIHNHPISYIPRI